MDLLVLLVPLGYTISMVFAVLKETTPLAALRRGGKNFVILCGSFFALGLILYILQP